ncbi:ATP-dependent DNA helicase [Halalkalibacterium halodurans C-125]|uniref:DNA 3'-5' helicase n=1 Tax=Halalkalibacterium halodurans (strain ATCC BAA-125 / DSM 18197 / FERM 7344 / JCM 9153 / C-125) TaxID=272558 RepID=Q9K917_HALH5|nr:ATP-dependent helicase [Halalkalibacterium halodurans]BAB06553.1 ATP-dependent DNA helicase [Halalkalibacterium halodurans C-125]
MRIALHNGQHVDLAHCDRQDWQKLYMASVGQEIKCMHCGKPVRLRLTIQHEPTFVHRHPSELCLQKEVDYIEQKQQVKSNHTSSPTGTFVGSFRLPKQQKISNGSTEMIKKWKEPERMTSFPPFIPNEVNTNQSRSPFDERLKEQGIFLNDDQWQAITTTEGPLLIIAGAGSGKTRVLTTRAAYMISEQQIDPLSMLLVTFTQKAAREMQERMSTYFTLPTNRLKRLAIGTFHSIFYRIAAHATPEKWRMDKLLKWDWQRMQLLREHGQKKGLDEKEFAYDQALTQISWWKNHMLHPGDIQPKSTWEENCLYLYEGYERSRISQQWFDFDDMLIGAYETLTQNHELLARYQERFRYLFVDEYQDINKVQYELIRLLTQKEKNICVVGDDDQSIYSFRGSDPSYIQAFERDYEHAKQIVLKDNYRSSHPIVMCAQNVIHHNKQRIAKSVRAQYDSEKAPLLFYPYDEEEEATMILSDIQEKIASGTSPSAFAILYRTNVSVRAMFERLVASNVPFRMEQEGESFYQRSTVRKVLAYLRLSVNQDDPKAMEELLPALFLKKDTLQELKAITIFHDCSLLDALLHLKNVQPFQQKKLKKLLPYFQKLPHLSPTQAISMIEKHMGLTDFIKKRGNEGNVMDRGSDDLKDLIVAANSFATIPTFLDHVSHMIAKHHELKKAPAQEEAVQLMTIHRAKGLEFQHVYLLSAVEGSLPHDYALDAWREGDDRPLEEERRLMYVAMTRAQEQLFISVPSMRRGKNAQRSRFVREMLRNHRQHQRKGVEQ